MPRKTLDLLLSSTGAILAIVLLIAGGLLTWAASFANTTVSDQLSAQRITMPQGQAIDSLENEGDKSELRPFAGQPLNDGPKAKAYADHYILAHMNKSSGGRTYSEVSSAQSAAAKDPAKADESKRLLELKQTLFQGDALRSMLLTAYAFGTIGTIARIASIVAFGSGALLLALALLGFGHARKAAGLGAGGTAASGGATATR